MKITPKSVSKRRLELDDVNPGEVVLIKGIPFMVCTCVVKILNDDYLSDELCVNLANGQVEVFPSCTECERLVDCEFVYDEHLKQAFTK